MFCCDPASCQETQQDSAYKFWKCPGYAEPITLSPSNSGQVGLSHSFVHLLIVFFSDRWLNDKNSFVHLLIALQ